MDLAKPIKIQFTKDQSEALSMLKELGFNKNKFIRAAVEEKLYRDFRRMLKKLRDKQLKQLYPSLLG
jgi:hypothetical protein